VNSNWQALTLKVLHDRCKLHACVHVHGTTHMYRVSNRLRPEECIRTRGEGENPEIYTSSRH